MLQCDQFLQTKHILITNRRWSFSKASPRGTSCNTASSCLSLGSSRLWLYLFYFQP